MIWKKQILIHNEPNMQDVIQACLTTFAGWNVRVANSTLEGVPQGRLSQPKGHYCGSFRRRNKWIAISQTTKNTTSHPRNSSCDTNLRSFWGDLQQSWFQQNRLPAVIVNPLNPAMLCVQTANVLAWDLESPDPIQGTGNRAEGTGRKPFYNRNRQN